MKMDLGSAKCMIDFRNDKWLRVLGMLSEFLDFGKAKRSVDFGNAARMVDFGRLHEEAIMLVLLSTFVCAPMWFDQNYRDQLKKGSTRLPSCV